MEPIRSIENSRSDYSSGLRNLLSARAPSGYYVYTSKEREQLDAYNQREFDEASAEPSYDRDAIREEFFSLTNSLVGLSESFEGKRNLTYSRTSRQDRVMPADFETKRTMFNAGDIGSILAGSYNMPRLKEGSITINNTVIAIDPNVDSFADIVERISNSTAGVTARYDSEEDTLVISSRSNGKIEITNDTANFLEEGNIAMSTHEESTETLSLNVPGGPRSVSDALMEMNEFVRRYNSIIENDEIPQEIKDKVTESTKTFIAGHLSSASAQKSLNVGNGSLHFDFSSEENKPITYDQQKSYNAIKKHPGLFVAFFASKGGYADKIKNNIDNALSYIEANEAGENINIRV